MSNQIFISASSIYSFDCCDGLVISRLKSPRLKLDYDYLEKGKIFHSLFETFGDDTDHSRSIEQIADEYEESEIVKDRYLSREYYQYLSNDFKEVRFNLTNFFENPDFILSGRTDAGAVYDDKKLIVVIDYKSSREVSQKDVEQIKTYIVLINELKEYINPKYKNYRVEGLLDYIFIDELLPVRLSTSQINLYKANIKNIVQSTLTKIISYLEKKDDISIEYNFGSHCTLCPSKGTCPVHKTIVNATSVYLYGEDVENTNDVDLVKEYTTLSNFSKIIKNRLESLRSSLEFKSESTSIPNVKPSFRKNYSIAPQIFKDNILTYADENKLDYRNIFIDVSNDLIKPLNSKQISSKIPNYLKDAFETSKNLKSVSRSIRIVDPQKDEQDSLSDFY